MTELRKLIEHELYKEGLFWYEGVDSETNLKRLIKKIEYRSYNKGYEEGYIDCEEFMKDIED